MIVVACDPQTGFRMSWVDLLDVYLCNMFFSLLLLPYCAGYMLLYEFIDCLVGWWVVCNVDLLPNDPAVEVGGVLELICRILRSYGGDYNSSSICFGHNNERYCGAPAVTLIDNSTARLRFANMTLDNSGHFNCELPDLTGQWHAQQSVTVASKQAHRTARPYSTCVPTCRRTSPRPSTNLVKMSSL